ncbi:hypothetical protein JKG68_26035 [Microvirga aerilata]|uniref:Uncharacterized protein n=1 Tax=Microvirga aerilata TaxID=670292 RepID=A0A937CYU5_9HYPH|nr:hypothetical protein [Microvirga aerilata]MBL0407383.1 hypothetical protein [Microvirga aerilata]
MELMGIQSEEELEQFLGKMFKSIGRGLKKVGAIAAPLLKPLGGALKGLAKKALPFVGGALGSFIPIPGVGTAIGTALGSAVSQALEMEFNELEQEEAEFEMARRFVRIAADATQQALLNSATGDPQAAVRDALVRAAQNNVPGFNPQELEAATSLGELESYEGEYGEMEQESGYGGEGRPASGRWLRRGRRIVLMDL